MMFLGQVDKAQICLNQAYYITKKYNIKFDFDVTPEHYMLAQNAVENAPEIDGENAASGTAEAENAGVNAEVNSDANLDVNDFTAGQESEE